MKKLMLLAMGLFLLWACSTDSTDEIENPNPNQVSFDRGVMLTNWADNIIIPSYVAFSLEMSNLNAAL